MKKINKQKIMRVAWDNYKTSNSCPFLYPLTFAECLKDAWEHREMFMD